MLDKLLNPLRRQIGQMLTRALVTNIVDSFQRQNIQVKMHADESADNIERFQNYGFSSVPTTGAEAVMAALGGNLGQLVAIAVEDKTVRPKDGASGDVFLYHLEGHRVQLTKDGQIIITATSVTLNASQSCSIIAPTINLMGDINANDTVSISQAGETHVDGDITASDFILKDSGIKQSTHKHRDGDNELTTEPVQ